MEFEPEISFRNVVRNEALDRMILEGIERLEAVDDRIVGVRIAVEDRRGTGAHDSLYRVRIEVSIPGRDVIVKEAPDVEPRPTLDEVLNKAFEVARRRLKEAARVRRGNTRRHVSRMLGRVARLFPADEYGFIEDVTGREVYFHRNSVADGQWAELERGDGVEFQEEQGDEGPQAVVVFPLE